MHWISVRLAIAVKEQNSTKQKPPNYLLFYEGLIFLKDASMVTRPPLPRPQIYRTIEASKVVEDRAVGEIQKAEEDIYFLKHIMLWKFKILAFVQEYN